MTSRPQKLARIFGMMKRLGIEQEMRFALIGEAVSGSQGKGGFSACSDADLQDVINYLANHPKSILAKQQWLKGFKNGQTEAGQSMRRKLIAMAHDMKWQLPTTGKCDMARLNNWCSTYGKYKKPLMEHTDAELVQLITQFEIVHADFIKSLRK